MSKTSEASEVIAAGTGAAKSGKTKAKAGAGSRTGSISLADLKRNSKKKKGMESDAEAALLATEGEEKAATEKSAEGSSKAKADEEDELLDYLESKADRKQL